MLNVILLSQERFLLFTCFYYALLFLSITNSFLRQIVSGSRDKSIRLWNTLGECKITIDDAHADWVSCVQFSPNIMSPTIISAGWDKIVKIWTLGDEFKLKKNLIGHTG